MDIPALPWVATSLPQGSFTLIGKMFSLYPVGIFLDAIRVHSLSSFPVHLWEGSALPSQQPHYITANSRSPSASLLQQPKGHLVQTEAKTEPDEELQPGLPPPLFSALEGLTLPFTNIYELKL